MYRLKRKMLTERDLNIILLALDQSSFDQAEIEIVKERVREYLSKRGESELQKTLL